MSGLNRFLIIRRTLQATFSWSTRNKSSRLYLKSISLRPRSGLNDNSPALQRWETSEDTLESVKRTTEKTYELTTIGISRPFHGLHLWLHPTPTDESVGYRHSSALPTFEAKQVKLTVRLLTFLSSRLFAIPLTLYFLDSKGNNHGTRSTNR